MGQRLGRGKRGRGRLREQRQRTSEQAKMANEGHVPYHSNLMHPANPHLQTNDHDQRRYELVDELARLDTLISACPRSATLARSPFVPSRLRHRASANVHTPELHDKGYGGGQVGKGDVRMMKSTTTVMITAQRWVRQHDAQ